MLEGKDVIMTGKVKTHDVSNPVIVKKLFLIMLKLNNKKG